MYSNVDWSNKRNSFTLKKEEARNHWHLAEIITDVDWVDDVALLVNTPTQAEFLQYSLEKAAGGVVFCMNANKNALFWFKQEGASSSISGKFLKINRQVHILQHQYLIYWKQCHQSNNMNNMSEKLTVTKRRWHWVTLSKLIYIYIVGCRGFIANSTSVFFTHLGLPPSDKRKYMEKIQDKTLTASAWIWQSHRVTTIWQSLVVLCDTAGALSAIGNDALAPKPCLKLESSSDEGFVRTNAIV